MIPIPTCQLSNHRANKFCINQQCASTAFICKSCQNQDCLSIHQHYDDKIDILLWSQISRQLEEFELNNPIKKERQFRIMLQKQLNSLIDGLKLTLKVYQTRMTECMKQLQMKEDIQNTIEKIKQKRFNQVTGKQMRKLFILFKVPIKIQQQQDTKDLQQLEKIKTKEQNNITQFIEKLRENLDEYFLSKQKFELLKGFNQKIKEQPNNCYNYLNRAIIFYNHNQLDRALNDYNKAIEYQPRYANSYYKRGNLYKTKNELEKALADYDKAIQLRPKFSKAYYKRGTIYQELNQTSIALTNYTNAIQSNPESPYAYINRAKIYEKNQENQKALIDYTQAIKYDKKNAVAYNSRGCLYEKNNMLVQAKNDYEKAIQSNKQFKQAFLNLKSINKKLNLEVKEEDEQHRYYN